MVLGGCRSFLLLVTTPVVFHRVQSHTCGTWLLSYECSVHVVVVRKSVEKFLSTNTRKRSITCQRWKKRCSLKKSAKIVGKTIKCFLLTAKYSATIVEFRGVLLRTRQNTMDTILFQ